MENFEIPDNLGYTEEIRKFEETDPAHADLFNAVLQALVNNDAFIKRVSEEHMKNLENPHKVTKSQVGLENVPNVSTGDQTPTFAQASTRANIISGEKLSTIFGKLMKWFVDLKTVAFSGKYTDLTDKPTIPAAVRVKGNVESAYRTGDVNLTAANIGAVNKGGDAMSGRLNFINDGDIRFVTPDVTGGHARGINFIDKNGTDIRGGIGVTGNGGILDGIYLSIGTAYPWSNNSGIYITNSFIKWKGSNLVTENSGVATAATKAAQDGNGNNIVNTYAKKSIYGDTEVSLGRKSGTISGSYSAVLGGYGNTASGSYSFVLGDNNTAESDWSSALGGSDNTASGNYSAVLGGSDNTASGSYSAVLGGYGNTASGSYSAVLGGYGNTASGGYSAAMGYRLLAESDFSTVCGRHNARMASQTAFVVGNGIGISQLSNAFSVMFSGVVKAKSTITGSTTADYAEFFEWLDGNPNNEDRVGRFVTLNGNKITIANSNEDYILGIVSGEPFVLGNGDCDTWNGMYMKDDFNRTIYEPAPKMELNKETGEQVSVVDENGDLVYEGTRPKLNPKYDPEQPYISRFDRKEWSPVGMLGVLSVIDDGSCQVDGFCCCSKDGIATACEKEAEGACRVTERISENVVRVVLK